jgi:hypothetical protein
MLLLFGCLVFWVFMLLILGVLFIECENRSGIEMGASTTLAVVVNCTDTAIAWYQGSW